MDNPKISIRTRVFSNGNIEQLFTDSRGEMMRMMLRTQDEAIKEALIKLGWTPPATAESEGKGGEGE